MYKMLQRNLRGYFSFYKEGDTHYHYQVAEILKGFMSKELYDRWRLEEPEKYAEVNRLVYHIKQSIPQFPRFETLSLDLCAMGYETKEDSALIDEHILERLKIIHMCLGGAYIEFAS